MTKGLIVIKVLIIVPSTTSILSWCSRINPSFKVSLFLKKYNRLLFLSLLVALISSTYNGKSKEKMMFLKTS